jgi:hypothetical protein
MAENNDGFKGKLEEMARATEILEKVFPNQNISIEIELNENNFTEANTFLRIPMSQEKYVIYIGETQFTFLKK